MSRGGIAASLIVVSGCTSGEEPPARCAYEACPIEDAACVEAAALAVACKLGRDPVVPEVRYVTAEALLAEWSAEAEPPSPSLVETLRAGALLGLMPPDYDPSSLGADQMSGFVGFYDPETVRVTILVDQLTGDPTESYAVLVHELVHAYQDAAVDLRAFLDTHGGTYDRALGARSLVEGEATVHMTIAFVEALGKQEHDLAWVPFFDAFKTDALEADAESPTPWIGNSPFPYAFGGSFVHGAWARDRLDAVEELYELPPDSARQVLAGYDSWPDFRKNADAALDGEAVAVLGPEFALQYGEHESVWVLNNVLQRTAGGPLLSEVVDEVAADYLTVFREESTGELVVIWRLETSETDHPSVRDAFLSGSPTLWVDADASSAPATHVVALVEDDVVLVATTPALDARAVLGSIQGWQSVDQALPEESSGRPMPWSSRAHGPCLGGGAQRR